jgi:hypothetical protein
MKARAEGLTDTTSAGHIVSPASVTAKPSPGYHRNLAALVGQVSPKSEQSTMRSEEAGAGVSGLDKSKCVVRWTHYGLQIQLRSGP